MRLRATKGSCGGTPRIGKKGDAKPGRGRGIGNGKRRRRGLGNAKNK